MTEPNEPKIVHFPPRAQAPVQDTAGNWEPDEQLFARTTGARRAMRS